MERNADEAKECEFWWREMAKIILSRMKFLEINKGRCHRDECRMSELDSDAKDKVFCAAFDKRL